MKTEKSSMTIQEFSAQFANSPESTPEIQAFGRLATIASPAKVEEAISPSLAWGWW